MCLLEVREQGLYIGAAVPLNRVKNSPDVQWHARALAEAAALIGGPQVRNTATLGGNVGHALPAGDGTIALLALAAEAEIASLEGRRRLPVEELFIGPGKSILNPRNELLVGFYLPANQKGDGSAFRRVMRPQGVAIAIMNMGMWIKRLGEIIQDIRISIGPAGPKPFRARAAEAFLRGKIMKEENVPEAVEAVLYEAKFRTSPHRSTAEYRRHLVAPLLEETLKAAWDDSIEKSIDPVMELKPEHQS
jgi:carbon-monoxide dehydrogenase medium subunit